MPEVDRTHDGTQAVFARESALLGLAVLAACASGAAVVGWLSQII